MPKQGIEVAGFHLHLPNLKSLYGGDTTQYADISNLISEVKDYDSLPDIDAMIAETAQQKVASADAKALAANIYRLQFPNGNKQNLMQFFANLQKAYQEKKTIRIMHYGDSQTEGDRITSYLRHKLQSKYGGSGPGLLPALQPYDSHFSIRQSNTGQWVRYPIFGKIDKQVLHANYGPLAAFSRFAPIVTDSNFKDITLYKATVNMEQSKMAYATASNFQKIRILYGNAKRPVTIKLFVGEQIVSQSMLEASNKLMEYSFTLAAPTQNIRIEFSGYDSPDIYGISLEPIEGVIMDNVGMRGCSGTFFNKINYSNLRQSYEALDVQLFILQFGGNVMPYMKDTTDAVDYGRWFYRQLATIKKIRPKAGVIVIGPSDMSYKSGNQYLTYPFLPVVRDEMRKAAFKAGYAYWDMYEAMGGYNSMPSWALANPPLAGPDYTHFTPNGAKLISNMFYNALMIEANK
jgi:hypothetical protein